VAPTDLDQTREKYRQERAKRVGGDRDATLELTGDLAHYLQDPYRPARPRAAVGDAVDVTIVGGGFGGLLCGAMLRGGPFGQGRVRVIDRAGDFGGVWYWNRYPGAQCDIESYIYLPLLEETGTIPTEKYAHAPEIFDHARTLGRHYDLYDLALFHTSVTGATWHEAERQWEVATDRGDRFMSRYLILAIGSLDKVKLPAIPGAEDFAGHSFHTSRWDYEYTGGRRTGQLTGLRDKSVGVVGTGATALQCVPYLGAWAGRLHVFQRTPSTVGTRGNRPTDPAWAASLQPGWQERRMRNFTAILAGGDADTDLVDDSWTRLYTALLHPVPEELGVTGPADQGRLGELADLAMMERIRGRIDSVVTDPRQAAALKPYYRYLCKRPGFHDDYLNTFNRPSVCLVDTGGAGIERVVPGGVVAGGRTYHLDCLVWATGFEWNTSYTSRIGFDLRGRDGASLAGKWRDGMATLHGMTTHRFPNFFTLPGPNSQAVVTTNFMHTLTECARHVSYIIGAAEESGAGGFAVTEKAEREWVSTILGRAKYNAEFQRACTPGRFNNEGRPDGRPRANTNFGDGPLEFFRLLENWRADGALAGLDLLR
jgi:cyclohexanone monooxygenase